MGILLKKMALKGKEEKEKKGYDLYGIGYRSCVILY